LRYAQVLDTDYNNYLILYSCYHVAEYYTKTEAKSVPYWDIWELATKVPSDDGQVPYRYQVDSSEIHEMHLRKVKI